MQLQHDRCRILLNRDVATQVANRDMRARAFLMHELEARMKTHRLVGGLLMILDGQPTHRVEQSVQSLGAAWQSG